MPILVNKFLIATAVLLCFSCNKDKLNDPGTLIGVEDEFYVNFRERLSPVENQLELVISTIEDMACQNYILNCEVIELAEKFIVSVNDIVAPEDCIPGAAPAIFTYTFKPLPTGFYRMEINLSEQIINKGVLSVGKNRYSWTFNTLYGIVPEHDFLLKVPPDAVWGYIEYADGSRTIADDFIADLTAMSKPNPFDNGYYGHYSVKDGQATIPDAPATSAVSFLFHYEGGSAPLTGLLQSYRDDFGQDIRIVLRNAQGESL